MNADFSMQEFAMFDPGAWHHMGVVVPLPEHRSSRRRSLVRDASSFLGNAAIGLVMFAQGVVAADLPASWSESRSTATPFEVRLVDPSIVPATIVGEDDHYEGPIRTDPWDGALSILQDAGEDVEALLHDAAMNLSLHRQRIR